MKKRVGLILLLAAAALTLAACAADGQDAELPPEPENRVLIYAALNPVTDALDKSIAQFNTAHEDVQIEVRDYSDENGVQRLLTELALGQVPDIMELHRLGTGKDTAWAYDSYADRPEGEYRLPYRQMVQKGYLEDLWPYIENDPELGLDGVLMPPLKAAEVNGGLYMIFPEFSVTTLFGAEPVLGDRWGRALEGLPERYSAMLEEKTFNTLIGTKNMPDGRWGWTLEELLETFSAMPEDSTVLRWDSTRWDAFSMLYAPMLEQYVDMETGENSFDSQEFRDMMEFLSAFPDEFKTTLSPDSVRAETVDRMLGGEQLLEAGTLRLMQTVTWLDADWGAPASFIGYPTADGSLGSYFNLHGNKLAMGSTCQDKEAAWEFMRKDLAERHSDAELRDMKGYGNTRKTCINLANYNQAIYFDLTENLWVDNTTGRSAAFSGPLGERLFEVDMPNVYDLARFEMLIHNTTRIYWPNDDLSNIVWETIGPYFAGDRSMEDTIQNIQNKVKIYWNENR